MYRITQCLSVGRFATAEGAAALLAAGVTHVLNVSGGPGEVTAGGGSFREVAWFPLDDSRPIPADAALRILDDLHRMASDPGAHVYVHCRAGQLRSPTVLWLYLIACGFDPEAARKVIESRSPDAAPDGCRLAPPDLIALVRKHGRTRYLPHPRGEALVPFGREPLE